MMKTILNVVLVVIMLTTFLFGQDQWPRQFKSPSKSVKSFDNFKANKTLVPSDSTELDSFLLAKMNQYHLPGLSACIVKDDQIIWKGAYGYANIEQNKLVTDSTLFSIQSVSKPVTATAIMQLWEEDLFELDDDVNNYLPFQVRNPSHPNDPITFRMLLTHTSGIHSNWNVITFLDTWGVDSPITLDFFLVNYLVPGGSYYDSDNYNSWAPGSDYEYCNENTTLLGYLVETITNISFEQYCQDSIFVPLGMNETSWFLANLDANNIAMLYEYSGGSYDPLGHPGGPSYPAWQLRTSPIQLSRFLRAYIQKGQIDGVRILNAATIELMATVHDSVIDPVQGLHWDRAELNIPYVGMRIGLYHLGGGGIAAAAMAYILETGENVGMIVLANSVSDNGRVEIAGELLTYGLLQNVAYAHDVTVNKSYAKPGTDSVNVTAQVENPNQHELSPVAYLNNIDDVAIDSLSLFDDGAHGDGLSNDNIWGNIYYPLVEESYAVSVKTNDLTEETSHNMSNLAWFTTIGPLVVDSVSALRFNSIFNPNRATFDVYLKNMGQTTTAMDVSARIYADTSDLCLIGLQNYREFGDIESGQRASGRFTMTIDTACLQSDTIFSIPFTAKIASGDHVYWTDVNGEVIVNDIEELSNVRPAVFRLNQNYPNPFNPVTMINYQLPMTSDVELSIYNLLGQKVVTLINEQKKAGSHQVEWEASGFSSGIYFYRIEAGEFQDVKKMVLLR